MEKNQKIKTVQDSLTTELMNPQRINPTAMNGKNSEILDLKMFPKIAPMVAIMIPVDKVIQKGPNVDLRYLLRISALAK